MFESSFWTWLILAGILIILEIMTPIYYFLWLGLTSAVVGLISWLFPELDFLWQMLIFSVLALTSVFLGRIYIKPRLEEIEATNLNRRADQYVGRIFSLDENIINGESKSRLDGITWKVMGPDCKAGTIVRVVSISQKSILVVEPEE